MHQRRVSSKPLSNSSSSFVSTPPLHHHVRQGSVSSTSTSSGSLGSSGFVSPKKIITSHAQKYHRENRVAQNSNYIVSESKPRVMNSSQYSENLHIQLPSSNSAFRRPKPIHDKRKELEQYANQWQLIGNRRFIH